MIYKFAKEVYRDYRNDNGSLIAAAVSFYVFMSIVPVAVLAVAVVGYLLGSAERAQDIILCYVGQLSPGVAVEGARDIRQVVEGVIRGRHTATGLGLAALLWAGTTVVVNLEQAINLAWGVREKRGPIAQRLLAVGVLVVMGVLLGLSFLITTAANTLRSLDVRVMGLAPSNWPWVWSLIGYAVPLLLSVATFTLFYKVVPNTRVRFREALLGGVFAGVAWEAAKYGFSYYATHFGDYGKVYGSLGGIILLLIWIYYSSVVTIMGAEVASIYAGRHPG